jgi:hypothetical protein
MTTKARAILAGIVIVAICWSGRSSGEEIRLFIIAGQSNAGGAAPVSALPIEPVNLRLPQTNVLFSRQSSGFPGHPWRSTDGWESLKPASGDAERGRFGPEVTFGYEVSRALPGQLAILKFSLGASSLKAHWRIGGGDGEAEPDTYDRFVRRVRSQVQLLLDQGHQVSYEALVWSQG